MTDGIDLGRHRELAELLGDTWRLFTGHLAVILSVTLLLVTPVALIVDGVWGRGLADGIDADTPVEATFTSAFLQGLVVGPLATALLVVIVLGVSRREEPTFGGALRSGSERFLPALGTVLLGALGVALGLIALVVPGIWLAVRWYVGAQAAVVDGLAPVAALRRSAELVKGRWWRTFGYLIVANVLFGLIVGIVGAAVGALASEASGALYMATAVVAQAVALGLTAIFATLLFFDLRARQDVPWEGTALPRPDAPENPFGTA